MRGNNGGRSLEGCKFARRLPMLPNAFVVAGVALFVASDRADAADEKMREKMVLLPNADASNGATRRRLCPRVPSLPCLPVIQAGQDRLCCASTFPPTRSSLPTPTRRPNLTVISGELYHQMGEKLDANSGDQLKPGAFVYLPATMPHSVSTKGENNRRATGTGPLGLDYINPADDPNKSSPYALSGARLTERRIGSPQAVSDGSN